MSPRSFLRTWIVVALVAAVAGVALASIDRDRAEDQVIEVTTPMTGDRGLPPGQVVVTGTLTDLHAGGAVVQPRTRPTPIHIGSERGLGNGAEITHAVVGGADSTIVWDAGRPLDIVSGPGLVLDPLTVGLSPDGFLVALGGTVCGFLPGSYTIATPVAVGSSGVAQPRDSVRFDATDRTQIAFTGSPAIVADGSRPLVVTGPGRVVMAGALRLVSREGVQEVARVELARGPYELTLRRQGASFSVEARLQGRLEVRQR